MDKFRLLRADEIDCRVSQVKEWGLQLLLYKDARCDQNILDETVGAMCWQRRHTRDNANCIVSLWDSEKGQWIEKEDTGTESNTEAAKGLASDSFKRACVNWGIGRELYTAPQMRVWAIDLKNHKQENGKWKCFDTFRVTDIQYAGRSIATVTVENMATGNQMVFANRINDAEPVIQVPCISEAKVKALLKKCADDGIPTERILKLYKVKELKELTETKHANIIQHWDEIKRIR